MKVSILVKDENGLITLKDCLCFDTCINCGGIREKRSTKCYISGNFLMCDAIFCECMFIEHNELFYEFKIIFLLNELSIDLDIKYK